MARIKLIVDGITQFDSKTLISWHHKGEIHDSPLTPFIQERLGKYFEIVGDDQGRYVEVKYKAPKPKEDVLKPKKKSRNTRKKVKK